LKEERIGTLSDKTVTYACFKNNKTLASSPALDFIYGSWSRRSTLPYDGIEVSLSEVGVKADAIMLFLAIIVIFAATPSALLFKQCISLLYIQQFGCR
jgi:hypothetical protein